MVIIKPRGILFNPTATMRHILRNIFNIQLPFIKLKSIILRRIVKFIQLGSQKFSGLIILYLKIIMVDLKIRKSIILRRIIKFIQLGSQKCVKIFVNRINNLSGNNNRWFENKKIDYSTSNRQVYSTWIAKIFRINNSLSENYNGWFENKKIDYSTSNHQVYSTWIAKVSENFRKQD